MNVEGFSLQGLTLGSQGTDRLDRVPRGKEVRARVIESSHAKQSHESGEIPIVWGRVLHIRLLTVKIRTQNERLARVMKILGCVKDYVALSFLMCKLLTRPCVG